MSALHRRKPGHCFARPKELFHLYEPEFWFVACSKTGSISCRASFQPKRPLSHRRRPLNFERYHKFWLVVGLQACRRRVAAKCAAHSSKAMPHIPPLQAPARFSGEIDALVRDAGTNRTERSYLSIIVGTAFQRHSSHTEIRLHGMNGAEILNLC